MRVHMQPDRPSSLARSISDMFYSYIYHVTWCVDSWIACQRESHANESSFECWDNILTYNFIKGCQYSNSHCSSKSSYLQRPCWRSIYLCITASTFTSVLISNYRCQILQINTRNISHIRKYYCSNVCGHCAHFSHRNARLVHLNIPFIKPKHCHDVFCSVLFLVVTVISRNKKTTTKRQSKYRLWTWQTKRNGRIACFACTKCLCCSVFAYCC